MKNTSKNQKSTASAQARIGTKKMKPKSRAIPKMEMTMRKMKVVSKKAAMSTRGMIKNRTSSATVQTSKKVSKQRKGSGEGVAHTKATPTTSNRFPPRTPEQKARSSSAHSTPSTAASAMSSSSKRAVPMMNNLALNSPCKKSETTLDKHSTVDFNDVLEFDWLSMSDIDDALVHHGEELSELNKFDYHGWRARELTRYGRFKGARIRYMGPRSI